MNDSNQPLEAPIFSHKKGPSKKVAVIIIAIVVLLGAAGAAAYIFRDQLFGEKKDDNMSTDRDQQKGIDQAALDTTVSAADTYALKGDTQQAAQVIDSAIKKTDSSAQKAALYSSKAALYYGKDTPSAISAAEQSFALSPDLAGATLLAQLYEMNGDKEKAIGAYEKAIDFFNKLKRSNEPGTTTAQSLQSEIDRLRGQ